MAEEVLRPENRREKKGDWSTRRLGSGTFLISKPKRSAKKLRQSRLKNRRRAR